MWVVIQNMIGSKKKGNRGENKFATFLRDSGLIASRNASSGGNSWKGDVHNSHNFCIEVKTVKKLNLMDAWRQVDRDSSLARNVPLLAIHFDGMAEGTWLIVMESGDWVEHVKAALLAPPKPKSESSRSDLARQLREIADDLDR